MNEPAPRLIVALAQINPTVGDLAGNSALIADSIRARARGGRGPGRLPGALPARLSGRGPVPQAPLRRGQRSRARARWRAEARGITALVGFAEPRAAADGRAPPRRPGAAPGPQLARGAPRRRAVEAVYRKNRLPNYGVFDEVRYFEPGSRAARDRGRRASRVGLTICEDLWEPGPPASLEAEAGAPADRQPVRLAVSARQGRRPRADVRRPRARLRGPDRLLQPGRRPGRARLRRPQLRRRRRRRGGRAGAAVRAATCCSGSWAASGRARIEEPLADLDEVYAALVLGVRDYMRKNGFERALVGLSGGIDSALVAMIAADALGADRLTCVVMPSPHSSDETQADARAIATNLGAELIELPIEAAMDAYEETLGEHWSRRRARGRERAGADPRQPADGALQRSRRAGADDGQQERDVGRLRDPVRRHGGRRWR